MPQTKPIPVEDANKLTQLCFDFYERSLTKNGKPTVNEWTTIAAIILDLTHLNDFKKKYKILSFASGTKCLAEYQLPTDGGDAAIIPKLLVTKDDESDEDECCPPSKKTKSNGEQDPVYDVYRTGARCVPNSSLQDSKEKGPNYHVVGVLRTKPGRGSPTISMSCSDKIAKWLVVGLQGSFLSNLLSKPIYLDGIIISNCQFSEESVRRAFIERSSNITNLPTNYKCNKPFIIQTNLTFKDSKAEKVSKQSAIHPPKCIACPTSICWSRVDLKPQIVLVQGSLLGVTQKTLHTCKHRLPICKFSLMKTFNDFLQDDSKPNEPMTYKSLKLMNNDYNLALKEFHQDCLTAINLKDNIIGLEKESEN